jgi:hypothetical protein
MPFRVESSVSSLPDGGHPSAHPSRQRAGGESPFDVRGAGKKSLGQQPFSWGFMVRRRVKAEPVEWPAASPEPAANHG